MKIQHTSIDPQRLGPAGAVRGSAGASKTTPVEAAAPVARTDSVRISDAGRALAAQQNESVEPGSEPLSAERIDEIRARILSGAYNSVETATEVARRMLQRGDV